MNLSYHGIFIASRHCEICKFGSKDSVAEEFCVDCEESHCSNCARQHSMHKLSASHKVKSIKTRITSCEPCKIASIKSCEPCKIASIKSFCGKCKEFYCKDCGDYHKAQKCSRDHELSEICIPENHIIVSVSDENADDTFLKLENRGSRTPPTENLTHTGDTDKGISYPQNNFDHKDTKKEFGDKERHESFGSKTINSDKKCIQNTKDNGSKTCLSNKALYTETSKVMSKSFSSLPDKNDFKINGDKDATVCTKPLKMHMQQVLENDPHSVKDCAPQSFATNSNALNLKSKQNIELLYDRQNQNLEAHEAELQIVASGEGIDSDSNKRQTRNTEQLKFVTRDATTQCKQAEMIQTTLAGQMSNRISDVDIQTMNDGTRKTSAIVVKRKEEAVAKTMKLDDSSTDTRNSDQSDSDIPAPLRQSKQSQMRPRQSGRPSARHIQSNHMTLTWPDLVITEESDVVEVFLKEAKYGSWRQYNLNCVDTKVSCMIEGLRPDTQYVFKIRLMNKNTGKTGPFSGVSDVIQTKSSPAVLYRAKSERLTKNSMVYQLPLKEDRKYLDKTRQIRKYSIGHQTSTLHEKTVILIGESGAGKSTMIDCLANYSLGVTMQDPFRFTLTSEDNQNVTVRAKTKWITIYTLHPSKESGFPFVLNMIDTPGLGGGKRKDEDMSLISSIEFLLKSIEKIDVVGVVLKSSDSRLSVSQRLLFDSVLAIFGCSISRNMCALITFCDSQTPPVVNAMKTFHQALPHDTQYFCFNNCSLFSTEKQESNREAFWKMGKVQFDLLIKYLSTVDARTVVLTDRQLEVREQIIYEIQYLEGFFMKAICEFNDVMRKHHKLQQKDIEKFEMETEGMECVHRPVNYKDQNTLSCTRCNKTCCRSCHVTRDIDRKNCNVFKLNGYCRVCHPAQCHFSEHINTNCIMEFIPVKKKAMFEIPHMDRQDMIRKLNHKRGRLIKNLLVILKEMTKKQNALQQKSRHPIMLTTLELIDSLIEITSVESQSYPSGTQHILHNLKDELPSQQLAIDGIYLEDVIKELYELK